MLTVLFSLVALGCHLLYPANSLIAELKMENTMTNSNRTLQPETTELTLVTNYLAVLNETISINSTCKCGILEGPTGKIVGGTPVRSGRYQFWPWFATLVHISRPRIAHCGGSLISPRYVISAAHCILPMLQFGLRHFRVKLGYNDLLHNGKNSTDNWDQRDISIESAIVHPRFELAYPYYFDIGLIKLSEPIGCSNQIRPICIPTEDLHLDDASLQTAITAGFGKTGINQNHSHTFLEIVINVMNTSECRHHFSKLNYKGPDILETMLCAWAKGKDTCVGDSGGPLFKLVNGRYEQIGVTSWGVGCANEHFPGVYSNVMKFLPWIKSNVID